MLRPEVGVFAATRIQLRPEVEMLRPEVEMLRPEVGAFAGPRTCLRPGVSDLDRSNNLPGLRQEPGAAQEETDSAPVSLTLHGISYTPAKVFLRVLTVPLDAAADEGDRVGSETLYKDCLLFAVPLAQLFRLNLNPRDDEALAGRIRAVTPP
eukprot:gene2036-biopygen66